MGRGGLLQTESRSFPSADGCAVAAPCGEESASSFALRPENHTRPVPDVPLARLQMARALGPVCAPRSLGSLARSALKQAPAQRSWDKYTRSRESPRASRPLASQVPVGAAVQGLLPAPLRPPSGALSSPSPLGRASESPSGAADFLLAHPALLKL